MSEDSSAINAANGAKEDTVNNNVAIFNHNGENWDETNLETLSEWVQIGSLQIETLDLGIRKYRSIIRQNVLLGLILSTASGSISISQISSTQQQFILNVFFTVMTFSIAIFTGLIKIYQIQERLEEYIQLKQEWIAFCVNITSEIQLPVSQRRDALRIIKDNKSKYLDLLKIDVDIGTSIKEKALENLYDDTKLQYMEEQASYLKLRNEINSGIFEDTASVSPTETHETIKNSEGCLYWNDYFNGICKKKFDGRKTSLSNILLTIMLEEEKTERDKRVAKLMKIKTEKQINNYQKDTKTEIREPQKVKNTIITNSDTKIDIDYPQFHLSEPTN